MTQSLTSSPLLSPTSVDQVLHVSLLQLVHVIPCPTRNCQTTCFLYIVHSETLPGTCGKLLYNSLLPGKMETCPWHMTTGNNFPGFLPGTSKAFLCAICMEKHLIYNRCNPEVSYKYNPHKRVKTKIWCILCKKNQWIKEGSVEYTSTEKLNVGIRVKLGLFYTISSRLI